MLRVSLFGELTVELDGALLPPPPGSRARGLLGWLALHPGLHPRGDLAARFWPDVLDASARASLRSAAWALRGALGDAGERYLVATRDRIGLDGERGLWVDARAFAELAAAGRAEDALALCRGELLAGLDDEWVLAARDEHRERVAALLAGLADEAAAQGDHQRALG